MEKNAGTAEEEKTFLLKLAELEDLAEKKTKIYSRLLTDTALADEMAALSLRHEERKETLKALVTGERQAKKGKGGENE